MQSRYVISLEERAKKREKLVAAFVYRTLYVLKNAYGGRGVVNNLKSLNKKCSVSSYFDNMAKGISVSQPLPYKVVCMLMNGAN
jgi:hypothetical protein